MATINSGCTLPPSYGGETYGWQQQKPITKKITEGCTLPPTIDAPAKAGIAGVSIFNINKDNNSDNYTTAGFIG